MATHELQLIGKLAPDTSGDIYPSTLAAEMSLTNSKATPCYVMEFPTGADIGFECAFVIPQNYVGTPELVIRGVLDGTPANVLAFTAQQVAVDDSETADVAYEAEDTASNSTWTGYADEDLYEETITLTPGSAYQPGDTVLLRFQRDDSVDTTTFNFLLTGLAFRYADA